MMQRFVSWANKGEYTAHGNTFDIGSATGRAIQRGKVGVEPLKCGGTSEWDNGNGSLMRILPIAYFYPNVAKNASGDSLSTFVDTVHKISSLTHAHPRSRIACVLYCAIANSLLHKKDKMSLKEAVQQSLKIAGWYKDKEYVEELKLYNRIFDPDFANLPEAEIKSSGYVVDTLEAALWCLLNTDNYKDCVLKAVNLGGDTDTVAAVAGGLAGMFYGISAIPKEWLDQLARVDYIKGLCEDFYQSLL